MRHMPNYGYIVFGMSSGRDTLAAYRVNSVDGKVAAGLLVLLLRSSWRVISSARAELRTAAA